VEQVDVAIIGAGFGGLAMAVELGAAGIVPVVILEAADGVGGTWRDNTYPGAACDVTSALYSFSFHPHVWTRKYPQQAEILEYIEEVVDAYGLRPQLRFGATVTTMTFDEDRGRWRVELADGGIVDARVVISSVGQLNQPAYPAVEGVGSFAGPAFHSARWDHSVELAGTRVGIIGTGASVIQFGPKVAEVAATTTIFQRSAPYVLPKPDPVTPTWKRRLYAIVPAAQLPARAKNFVLNEVFGTAIRKNAKLRAKVTAQWRAAMQAVVADEQLRAVCTPDYELGCKRALIADDWYPMVVRDDVDIVTSPIERIVPEGVVTGDGTTHELDVLVYGTGFKATEFLTPMRVVGRGGIELAAHWADGAGAFRGVATAGFPNLFVLYGPNTNLGANSIVYMLESQARYIAGLLTKADHARVGVLEVRPQAEAAWAAMIAAKSTDTAWVTGCHSWYTANGRNTNNWPDATWRYRRLLADVDLLDYAVEPARSPRSA
jgi:cation diffusion facilitator CzcD-associated flavoprotein CzcO